VPVFVHDDLDTARDAMRPLVALYVGGMGPKDNNFYANLVARYGFEEAANEIQDLYLGGHKQEAAAAIPGELIDKVSVCGPPDRVRERLRIFADSGVGTLGVTPMAFQFDERRAQLRHIAELAT
jgi:alkanesulfonate monooxygenase SsuD/methylene tetrahydromethanopterin reductase-like flavin-dependent oxidoreductase (luciferase family)